MINFINKHKEAVINLLFIIYMLVVLRFTIFRTGFNINRFMQNGVLNFRLFAAYLPYVRKHMWFQIIYLFGGNIVCFIPFGAYLRYRGLKLWQCVLLGFLFSFFIESMQYVWGVGISELDDLILNTFGVFLGALAMTLLKKYSLRNIRLFID